MLKEFTISVCGDSSNLGLFGLCLRAVRFGLLLFHCVLFRVCRIVLEAPVQKEVESVVSDQMQGQRPNSVCVV